MITYHGDRLVPAELCRILHHTVPAAYHVPIVFFSRRPPGNRYAHGTYHGTHIEVYLSPIWATGSRSYTCCKAAGVWRQLLKTCYHEFGHVATRSRCSPLRWEGYVEDWTCREYVEGFANAWAEQRMADLLTRDDRLFQPTLLGGYLGARHAAMMRSLATCAGGSGKATYVEERRCMKTGGQMTLTDVARHLGAPRWVVRQASEGIGIEYVDAGHRRHKLFALGDVPRVTARLNRAHVWRRAPIRQPACPWQLCFPFLEQPG